MDALRGYLVKAIEHLDQGACLLKGGRLVHVNQSFLEKIEEKELPGVIAADIPPERPLSFRSGGQFVSLKKVSLGREYSLILVALDREFNLSHDPLTGLYHRECVDRLFRRLIQDAGDEKKLYSVLFLDLDGFKKINDTWGHDKGDLVLKRSAERMLKAVRSNDYCFRFGGDEFLIVLTEIQDRMHACLVARRLISSISEEIVVEGNTRLKVGASIGIANYPADGLMADELIGKADEAMYQAKRMGKNNYRIFG